MLLSGADRDGIQGGDPAGSYKKSVDGRIPGAGELSTLGEPFANNHPMTIRKLKRLNRKIRYFSLLFGFMLLGMLVIHLIWIWFAESEHTNKEDCFQYA